jgi:hypothetical protein
VNAIFSLWSALYQSRAYLRLEIVRAIVDIFRWVYSKTQKLSGLRHDLKDVILCWKRTAHPVLVTKVDCMSIKTMKSIIETPQDI